MSAEPWAAQEDLRDAVRDLLKTLRTVRQPIYQRTGVPEGLMGLLTKIAWLTDGAENTRCHVKDLAERLALDASTVSRGVSALVSLGLVERHPDPSDRRASVLTPTEAGRTVLNEAQAWYRKVHAEALGDWRPEEIATFVAGLRRFAGDLDAYLAAHPSGPRPPTTDPIEPTTLLEAAR